MAHVSDIKLIRTDTTLDLSQKAEKGMISTVIEGFFYSTIWRSLPARFPMWDNMAQSRLSIKETTSFGLSADLYKIVMVKPFALQL